MSEEVSNDTELRGAEARGMLRIEKRNECKSCALEENGAVIKRISIAISGTRCGAIDFNWFSVGVVLGGVPQRHLASLFDSAGTLQILVLLVFYYITLYIILATFLHLFIF